MADIPYGGNAPAPTNEVKGPSAVQTLGTITNWSGAAVSLALVVGIGVWGYKMLARDVSGVPVVRAASGEPMRVAPEEPGGLPALHQGLAVNQVAAEGAAKRPADRLILAPQPVSLDDEDLPGATVRMANTGTGNEVAEPSERPVLVSANETPQMPSIRALADQLSSNSFSLDDEATDPQAGSGAGLTEKVAAIAPTAPPAKPEESSDVAAKAEVKGGLKVSLRPVTRPDRLSRAAVAAPAAGSFEVDPSAIPAGTKVAQLGAFDSPETARQEWDKLAVRFGDYLEGKQRVIQKAESGGRVFYRLRAMGFADLSDARRFCSALVAERADCIPVSTK